MSPLLSCLVLVPLSYELNETGYRCHIYDSIINHHFYTDDLKLYGKNYEEFEGLLSTVKIFTDDIGMEFDLDKCGKDTFIRGRFTSTNEIRLEDHEETYRYSDEEDGMQHAKMKDKIKML